MIINDPLIIAYKLSISFILQFSDLYIISANAKSKLNGWQRQRRGRGQQSNLTHWGCEQCVYMPKLVVCKWVWCRLTAPENSSRSGHMHFPEGSPRRHQDIFMICPRANHPPTPTPLATVILTTWSQAYVVAATFHKTPSCKGLILELWASGWLNGTREVPHLLGRNVWKKKINVTFLSQV